MQQMRRSGNKEENKRILMDLDVVLKSHDCPYIVQCFGTFITNVSPHLPTCGPRARLPPRGWEGLPCQLRASPAPCLDGTIWGGQEDAAAPKPLPAAPQTDVFIAMELMGTCAEKLKKRMQGPIPERILGKMTVAVSGGAGARPGRRVALRPWPPHHWCPPHPRRRS